MNNYQVQRLFAWSAIAAITFFFAAILLSGFIPPPSPSLTQAEVAAHYQQHNTGILSGMVLMLISGMFFAPLVGVISAQLRRIPAVSPALIYGQLSAGTAGITFFMVPAVLFLVTAYRPDRNPELTYLMNDLSWIMLVIPWPTFFMQNVIIGIAILADRQKRPVFPRWVSYFNFWVALAFLPGSLLPFFKQGVFAWSGLLVFWLAGSVFAIWFIVMAAMLLKAIRAQEIDERGASIRADLPAPGPGDVPSRLGDAAAASAHRRQ